MIQNVSVIGLGKLGAGGTSLSEAAGTAMRVAAVLAAYNRRDLTLACRSSLYAQQPPGVTLDAFVLDDASSDGTSESIASQFPEVTVLQNLGEELRRLWSTKELAPGPWAVYSRRWAGRLWPVYWLSPYVRRGVRLTLERTPLVRPRRAVS